MDIHANLSAVLLFICKKFNAMNEKTKLWFKRIGIGGFLFFLGKGIVWLIVLGYAGQCALK